MAVRESFLLVAAHGDHGAIGSRVLLTAKTFDPDWVDRSALADRRTRDNDEAVIEGA